MIAPYVADAGAKFKWKKWPVTAYFNQLCLVDWPVSLAPPGPKFHIEKLAVAEIAKLSAPFERNFKDPGSAMEPAFMPWLEGIYCIIYWVLYCSDIVFM